MTSSLPGSAPPLLVGREHESAVLRQHLDAAIGGYGSLVLVGGEAGIGKTALAEALCQQATEKGVLVLVGRCYDLSETPPYGPWIETFDRCRQTDGIPPLPTPFAVRGTVGTVTSQTALFQQVLDFFLAVAAQRPVTLFLDDLQWADPASFAVLRFLARNTFSLPLLLVVTYRADELTRRHPLARLLPTLVRESPAARLALHSLRPDDLAMLVRVRYSLTDADATRLVTYLAARADGNPFFLGELLHTLEEESVLRQMNGQWVLGDVTGVQVPPLLRQVMDARLARLGDDAQALLAVAAVIGQEVPLTVWARVADVDEETLVGVTERAIEAHLIHATSTSVRFVHALIREALYESIVPPRRRGWHRRVGEALIGQPDPDPDAVAYHFQQASDARAVDWLIAAGERARRAHADPTAIARFDSALALMDLADERESPERSWLLVRLALEYLRANPRRSLTHVEAAAQIAAHLDDPVLDVIIRHLSGFAHCYIGDFAQGVSEMRVAVASFDALSPDERQRLMHLLDVSTDTWRGSLLIWLAATGHLHEAVTLGERDVPPDITDGTWFRGLMVAYACLGHPDRVEQQFRLTRDLDRADRDTFLVSADYLTYLHYRFPYHADNLPECQRLAEEGEAAWQEARRAFPDLGQPQIARLPLLLVEGRWEELAHLIPSLRSANASYHGLIVSVVGPFARLRGDAAGAWEQVREILPHGPATAPGGTIFVVGQQMQRLAAMLALDARDLDTAREWLEAHDRWLAWSGAVLGRSEGQVLWAHYHRQAGEMEQARTHAERARADATKPRQPLALLAAHRLLGELDTDAGRYDDASRHLDAALALADACAAPFERALTLLALAALYGATGKQAEAAVVLDEIRALCLPLNAQPTLARADLLAVRLAGMRSAPMAYPAGLSPREVDVLRLLAAGRTNREIAAVLFVSANTVRTHITHILAKTNTDNRAAAAAFAQRHALT